MVMMQLQRLRDCSGSSEAGRRDRCGPPWELRSGQRRARRPAHQWPPPLSLLLLLHQQLLPERPLVLAPPAQGFEFGVRVSSKLERYSDNYVLCLQSADKMQRG